MTKHLRSALCLILCLALVFRGTIHADQPAAPIASGNPTGIAINDDENKQSIWRNVRDQYRKFKEKVMKYVDAVNSFGDLCWGAYHMYKTWQRVSQRAIILVHTNPLAGKSLDERVTNAEMWFRESDDILFDAVPNAEKQQAQFNKDYDSWVSSMKGKGDYDKEKPKETAESVRQAYLKSRNLKKTLDHNGDTYIGYLDSVYQATLVSSADQYAQLIQMDRSLEQEAAANQVVAEDVWGLIDCQDESQCGGITQRADMENRLGIMQNRQVRMANMVASQNTTALMTEVMNQVNIWTTQGNIGVLMVNGSRLAYEKFAKSNDLPVDPSLVHQKLWGMYPHAYHYDGKIYNSKGQLVYAGH